MKEVQTMAKKKAFDEWDVRSAADTLIQAQAIETDTRPGFYAAVKKELAKKVAAANKAASDAKITAKMHDVLGGDK